VHRLAGRRANHCEGGSVDDGLCAASCRPTIAGQLTSHGLTWREYAQDMGNDAHRDGTVMTPNGPACGHPKLDGVDLTDTTSPASDSYTTRRNPFMYFESITGKKSYCDSHVLSLSPHAGDLTSVATTPNYSFVTPDACFEGHDWPKCQDGTPGRLPRVDEFLKAWIPQIMVSPAYQQNGLILITFDKA
jgi:phosphatidylinositol-3-phosphatase